MPPRPITSITRYRPSTTLLSQAWFESLSRRSALGAGAGGIVGSLAPVAASAGLLRAAASSALARVMSAPHSRQKWLGSENEVRHLGQTNFCAGVDDTTGRSYRLHLGSTRGRNA